MLKTLIRNRYKHIEDEFKKLDRGSYGELTQDILFDLFKRFQQTLLFFFFLNFKLNLFIYLVLILNQK